MKRLALLAVGIGLAATAAAKQPLARIVVEGGGLTAPIAITDPRALQVGNVWFGQIVDLSKPTVAAPPRALGPYVVSFYVQNARDLRKVYALYYHPRAAGQPGYIYLPGEGDAWQYLNWGSIMRPGRDGTWSYAAPQWEALIKPAIAQADRWAARR